ncbi:MAG: SDR family NAD(P)-dependent oxidoreductase [Candidatus Binatus sp.]|uniref:SDR family NAD(P)-dependent oxidoreductase n=1 Tax=Candidatus Binatus sp. TaxID=2811406 RepID=UPI002724CD22|nr:SDR family NAD(P)-dependent oxidoreductase [Candidatus Binatus sp.]MDO8431256.1 SDR family NAD(P)-dependent oxidoreductase [Candidatus Binatus sp.]
MKLKEKVAVVTGTSANIGGGIAEGLAAEGAALVCVDAREENSADCARYINGSGGRAIAATCDVTDERQVIAAIGAARESFGGIDILVNSAAIFNKKGVLDMPLAEWHRQIEIILTGAFLFTKHAARLMIEQGRKGSIINIISTAGHQGEPNNIAYCTAKSGLLNFTRSAAMELVAHGIRVNSLTPTATDPAESFERAARWGRKVQSAEAITRAFEPFRKGVPMQKLPKPSDYGQAAAFLASDDAAMITGTDLRVDAGAIARYWAWNPSDK